MLFNNGLTDSVKKKGVPIRGFKPELDGPHKFVLLQGLPEEMADLGLPPHTFEAWSLFREVYKDLRKVGCVTTYILTLTTMTAL